MEGKIYDIVIIGGGCAGLTAAIYARRAEKSVLVLEKNAFGGQIVYSPEVENFPGFIKISGLGKLSAYATMALVKGDITGAEDETFTAGDMGEFTITKADDDGTEIVLGEPLQFTPDNVADYAKLY